MADQEYKQDNPAAALEALGNAARVYASLAHHPNFAAPAGFPPLGVDASALLVNPAAAVAAVAATFAAAQNQSNPAAKMAVAAPQPATIAAAPPATFPAPFGHALPIPSINLNPHHPPAPTPNPAAALAAASSLLPTAAAPIAAIPGANAVALNQMSAFLQAVGQQATQAQHFAAAANTAVAAAATAQAAPQAHAAAPPPVHAAAAPTPTPPPSYSPTPTTAFPQPRVITEPTAPATVPAPHQASFAMPPQVVVPAQTPHAATTAATMPSSALLPNIQNWSLEQLENHVKLLQSMKQPVPQSVALLLADARRKAEKKTAKRVANRKSACTSRARKKALVEEMTRTNARLRRQALILSLLPDLVIVISQEGEITFCSAQVERVLRHKIDNLIGSDIRDVLIPASRTALGKLVAQLTNPSEKPANGDGRARRPARGDGGQQGARRNKPRDEENGNVSGASSGSGAVSSGAAAVVSDQSFPLSVVKVESKQEPPSDENDNSDASGGGGKEPVVSSLSNSTARSPSASLANSGSGSDDSARGASAPRKEDGEAKNGERLSPTAADGKRPSSSDDSSSGSTETKNIRKANENLERNVRWHNKKLQSMSKSAKAKPGHKDDVLGDSVTPNNALARLSSLQHRPETKPSKKRKQYDIGDRSSSEDSLLAGVEENVEEKKKSANNENSSDDSGYRESNDSREETSSSASESSNSNRRNKPLAPTCNVCLIREDLTTLWCEVTSSIRTRSVEDETSEEALSATGASSGKGGSKNAGPANNSKSSSKTSTLSSDEAPSAEEKKPETKELLLCLRPIRDGDGKVDESLRFIPHRRAQENTSLMPSSTNLLTGTVTAAKAVSAGGDLSDPNSSNPDATASGESERKRPPKKRQLPLQNSTGQGGESGASPKLKKTKEGPSSSSTDTEKSVVESLMLMSHKSN